jgi:hypothetical protein
MTRRCLAILAGLAILSACAKKEKTDMSFIPYRPQGGGYSCQVPKAWKLEAATFGSGFFLTLEGPAAGATSALRSTPAALISLHEYRVGTPEFQDARSYMARQPGSRKGSGVSSQRDSLAVWTFDAETSVMFPPNSPKGKKIALINRYVIILKGQDSWVMQLSAPAPEFPSLIAILQRMAESFRPDIS